MTDYDDENYPDDRYEESRNRFRDFGVAIKRNTVNTVKAIADSTERTNDSIRKAIEKIDKWADKGTVGKYFQFRERRAKLSTELRAGMITFLMVAYVLALNPQILGVTGGTCDAQALCDPAAYAVRGNSCLFDSQNPDAVDCLSQLRMGLTTATAASSLIASFIIGFFANLPLALAPGMGINIYVAYQVVAQNLLTYEQAMVAIFLEGWIFIFLSVTGIRGGIIRLMPKNIAFASSAGIGLLLAFSGLRNLEIIVFDSNTLVTLGGCPSSSRHYVYTTDKAIDPHNYTHGLNISIAEGNIESNLSVFACFGGEMRSASMWLGLAGGVIMALLSAAQVRGSLFIGIAFITIISWIPNQGTSYLGSSSSIPGGEVRMDIFKQVVAAPSLEGTGLAWDWSAVGNGHFWVSLFTFLYIDLLDCTGTLLSMATLLDDCMRKDATNANKADEYEPFLNNEREFSGQQWAFLADGLGIVAGSMMGVTPVTVYIESAAGIEDGGRTGVSAIVVSFFFFIALFFSPIFSSIPPYATGPALILVGGMLIPHVDRIEWDNVLESFPAFLTIIIMPFTLSVAYGVIAGLMAWLILHLPLWSLYYSSLGFDKLKRYIKKRRRMSRGDSSDLDDDVNDGRGGPSQLSPNNSGIIYRTRSQKVHRKVFGDEEVVYHHHHKHTPSDGGYSAGEFSSHVDIPDPMHWGGGVGAHQSAGMMNGSGMMVPPLQAPGIAPSASPQVRRGGLRRSISQGSLAQMERAVQGAVVKGPGFYRTTSHMGMSHLSHQSSPSHHHPTQTMRQQPMNRSRTYTDVAAAPYYHHHQNHHHQQQQKVGLQRGYSGSMASSAGDQYVVGHQSASPSALGGGDSSHFQLFPQQAAPLEVPSKRRVHYDFNEAPLSLAKATSAPSDSRTLASEAAGEADGNFLLFGGRLLSLDLEEDAPGDGRGDILEGTKSFDLNNSQVNSPPDANLHALPSVDLTLFRNTMATSIDKTGGGGFGSLGDGSSIGVQQSGEDSSVIASLPTHSESGLTQAQESYEQTTALHDLSKEVNRTKTEGTTPRVEGWPGVDTTTKTATMTPAREVAIPDHTPGTGMKRIESAAALRLKSLFQSDDDLAGHDGEVPSDITQLRMAPTPSLFQQDFERDDAALPPPPPSGMKGIDVPETIYSGVASTWSGSTASEGPASRLGN